MEVVRVVLLIVEVLVCLLLAAIILVQQSKSQGLGVAFGGGMGESLFGSRAGNVLTKTTIILASVFVANTIALGILFSQRESTSILDTTPVPAMPQQAARPAPAPQGQALPPVSQAQGTMVMQDQPVVEDVAPVEQTLATPVTFDDAMTMSAPEVDVAPAPVASDEQPEPAPQP